MSGYEPRELPYSKQAHCNETHLCILRKGMARPQSQFAHSCVSERFMYSWNRSTYFPKAEQTDRSWENINRAQTLECGNWDCDRPIPFLGIFVSNFRYCVFAVHVHAVLQPTISLKPISLINLNTYKYNNIKIPQNFTFTLLHFCSYSYKANGADY